MTTLWKRCTERLICGQLDELSEMASEQNDRNTSWLTEILASSFQARKQLTSKNRFRVCHLYSDWCYIYRTRWNVFQILKNHSSGCLSSSDAVLLSLPGSEWNLINKFCLFHFGFLANRFLWRLSDPPAPSILSFMECLMAWIRLQANRMVSGSVQSEREGRRKRPASSHPTNVWVLFFRFHITYANRNLVRQYHKTAVFGYRRGDWLKISSSCRKLMFSVQHVKQTSSHHYVYLCKQQTWPKWPECPMP